MNLESNDCKVLLINSFEISHFDKVQLIVQNYQMIFSNRKCGFR